MKNKIKVSEYNKKYYLKHREQLLPIARKRSILWCKNNKEYRNLREKARRKRGNHPSPSAQKRFRLKRKIECISAYGGKCACCGETCLEMLAIDHIHNDGAKHRKTYAPGGGAIHSYLKKLNYPKDNFQCLCFNCNTSKYLGGGICFHQRTSNLH